jgi:hypothetical protein
VNSTVWLINTLTQLITDKNDLLQEKEDAGVVAGDIPTPEELVELYRPLTELGRAVQELHVKAWKAALEAATRENN